MMNFSTKTEKNKQDSRLLS